ncbi:hypothetical protein [Devosia sp.]|uniref:hypothetical protein n=1 Tax=Devosia sp. TaxID=1871048 RepID=UPI002AFDE4B4|nr:hypothetical protein [Devosia sp.]
MSDEQEPIVAPELPEPAAIAPAVEPETEAPELATDVGGDEAPEPEDSGDGGEPAEPEYVTLERNGKQYQVPKELEGEFLMQGDYTKKTQTVAEKAKALEAREAALVQQAEATDAELDARATLKGVNAQLAEYAKLTPADWQAHMQTDPLGTQQHRMQFEDLKAQKAELEGIVNNASNERTEKAQQDLAKRVQETLEAAPTIIPGLTAETRGPAIDKLVAFATSEGIPEQVLKANWSPVLLGLLHKAHIGAQAIAKQAAPKAPPKAPVTPLVTVKTGSSPTASKSLADLADSDDMEAYAAARAAGKKR